MKQSPFIALRYRDFRLLYLGILISRIGTEMQIVAVNWQVYILTGSAVSLGLIGLFRFLPIIGFSLFGGVAADVLSRKKIILFAQISMAIFSLVLALTTILGTISPTVIYLMIAANSLASAFETPARQALVPLLVPRKHFMNAVSMTTIIWQSAVLIGPSIGGFLVGFFGVESVYIVDTISFLGIILAVVAMKEPVQERAKSAFKLKTIINGLSFVRKTPMIYGTMLLDFFATFFSSAYVILPIFAKDILQVGPQGLGFLYAAPSFGAIVAGGITSSLGHIRNQGKVLLGAVLIYGLAAAMFGLSRSFYLSLFFLAVMGAGDIVSTILRNTIRQLKTPDRLRGRMVSINMIFFMGGPQLGEMEAGLLAALVGAPLSVITGGVGTIVATLVLAKFMPKLRKYRGDELLVS